MIDRSSSEPLYLQVQNHIREQIEQGVITIGSKLMSENEMQRFYGVARPTVRAALANLVNEGCLRKEHGRGTFCVSYPRRGRIITVDVIANQSDSYFYPYYLKGVSEVLEHEHCNLLLHDSRRSASHVAELLRRALERGTDGVIMPSIRPQDPAMDALNAVLEQYCAAKIPVVVLMSSTRLKGGINFTIDSVYGAKLAAQYLLDCGHRRLLGLFHFPDNKKGAYDRLSGFLSAIQQAPDAKGFYVYEEENPDQLNEKILRILREERITAVQCYNDAVAVDCLRLLVENGYRVPEDISLMGFDDTELSRASIPTLTTVVHPKDQLGAEAAAALLRLIRNPDEHQEGVVYRPGLVIRQSVRSL